MKALKLPASLRDDLKSGNLPTQKRALAEILDRATYGHIQQAYALQHWPATEIIRELRIRLK